MKDFWKDISYYIYDNQIINLKKCSSNNVYVERMIKFYEEDHIELVSCLVNIITLLCDHHDILVTKLIKNEIKNK
jgi:hypothetical protein